VMKIFIFALLIEWGAVSPTMLIYSSPGRLASTANFSRGA